MDYRERMAFGVFAPGPDGEEITAVGRYELNPRTNLAETAIVVGENVFELVGLKGVAAASPPEGETPMAVAPQWTKKQP